MPRALGRLGRRGMDQRDLAYPSDKVAQTGARRADLTSVRWRKAWAVAATLVLVNSGAPPAVGAR
jgi:hypothetical protein